ncbi:SH3 domain-containing protein [Flavobacterium fryxellicola]|uniref:BatE protein n=1 Tax=Flavobacterium fryxellicola TaxID=249352 RepID=A0A162PDH5_9FLAO|nr:tetratricopeptide repeat protein [Flavobacterium fryxellicola]OAB31410.1 BatE protein [Flavobacterium fryxellicola]SHN54078.1 SH3 domain-containing protein [Flavobacterium fryxellicola]
MKNILYILLLSTQVFFAQNGFEKGNAYYEKGQYADAVAAYESVLNDKQRSSEVYFNLGNAYYKLNKVAPSIYNYEKALVLNPSDKESLNNLKFAQKRTIDEIKVIPKVGFAKLVRDFTGIYHYNTWAWISVGLAVGFLLFFIGYYFSQITGSKQIFFFGMFVAVLLMLISISSAIFEKSHFDTEKPAIVFAEMTDFKSEPRNGGKPLFVLHEGTKVFVFESIGEWKKIQLTDGTEGWIESSAIKEVK